MTTVTMKENHKRKNAFTSRNEERSERSHRSKRAIGKRQPRRAAPANLVATYRNALGPIHLIQVRYAAAPPWTVFSLLRETAKRCIDPGYVSNFTQVARLDRKIVQDAFEDYQSSMLGQMFQSGPRWHANMLLEASRFIVEHEDATGLEAIYASALQSAAPILHPLTLGACVNIWERYGREGALARKRESFIYDASSRTAHFYEPGDLASVELSPAAALLGALVREREKQWVSGPSLKGGLQPGKGGIDLFPGGYGPGGYGPGGYGPGGYGPGGYGPGGYGPGGYGPGGYGPGGFGGGGYGPGGYGPGGNGAGGYGPGGFGGGGYGPGGNGPGGGYGPGGYGPGGQGGYGPGGHGPGGGFGPGGFGPGQGGDNGPFGSGGFGPGGDMGLGGYGPGSDFGSGDFGLGGDGPGSGFGLGGSGLGGGFGGGSGLGSFGGGSDLGGGFGGGRGPGLGGGMGGGGPGMGFSGGLPPQLHGSGVFGLADRITDTNWSNVGQGLIGAGLIGVGVTATLLGAPTVGGAALVVGVLVVFDAAAKADSSDKGSSGSGAGTESPGSDKPITPEQPTTPPGDPEPKKEGSGGKPNPDAKPNPMDKPNPMSSFPHWRDYYPNPEGTGGGGPASAGIVSFDGYAVVGNGVMALATQVGARSFRIAR